MFRLFDVFQISPAVKNSEIGFIILLLLKFDINFVFLIDFPALVLLTFCHFVAVQKTILTLNLFRLCLSRFSSLSLVSADPPKHPPAFFKIFI